MYIILETQTNTDGTVGTLITQFEDHDMAESKYHLVLASAAVSKLPIHSVFMLSDEGYSIRNETYRHQIDEEPNTEETSEE